MAEAIIDPRFPHVLIVTDESFGRVADEHRGRLRDLLYGELAGVVGRGTHDFWVTYRIPNSNDTPNHDYEDNGLRPRPMRGILLMEAPGDSMPATMANHTGVLFEEAGHHWCVPDDIRFRDDSGREIGMLGDRELVDRVFNGTPFVDPPLIARTRRHWSAYMEGDASPFDSVHWQPRGPEHGATRWDQVDPPTRTVTQAADCGRTGTATIDIASGFNDLDLVLMEALDPAAAYPSRGNRTTWLEPFLIANMSYHAGVTVALSAADQIYFGFYRDHRKLAVQRTGGPLSIVADLGDGRDLRDRTTLRVVRRGSTLLFQAGREGIDLDAPADETPYAGGVLTLDATRFKTVATLPVPAQIVAAGLLLKTWAPLLVELDVHAVALRDAAGRRSFPVDRHPPTFDRNLPYAQALSANELRRFDVDGPWLLAKQAEVWLRDGRMQLAARWGVNPIAGGPASLPSSEHWVGVDRAPKAMVLVQPGDFTFAATVRVSRALLSPSAGGAARGCSMWGTERSLPTRGVIVPGHVRDKWAGDAELRFAFIVAAPDRASVSDAQLQAIDDARRFWDAAFPQATRGRWRSRTCMANTWPDAALDVFGVAQGAAAPLVTASWRPRGGWGAWTTVGDGSFPADAPVAVVERRPTQLDVFCVGLDGQLWTIWWNHETRWGGWYPVRGTRHAATFAHRSPVSVVARNDRQLDVFVVGLDGQVWTIWWSQDGGGWGHWYPVRGTRHPATFAPGQRVSVIARREGQLDVFVAGLDGQVWTIWWNGASGWGHWYPVIGTRERPRFEPDVPVTVVARNERQLDVFAVADDGHVWTIWWSEADGWGYWYPVVGTRHRATFDRGQTVAAVSRRERQLDLFVAGLDGRVWTIWWNGDHGGWGHWYPVTGAGDAGSGPTFAPAAPAAAVARREGQLDLFATGNDGRCWTTWWSEEGGWGTWYAVPGSSGAFGAATPLTVVSRHPG